MKKIASIVILAASLIMGLTSCLSTTSAASSASASSSSVNVRMYVNAPTNSNFLYTLAAELGFKTADSSYDGSVHLSYSNPGVPVVADIAVPITKYYGYCEAIKLAIQQDTGRKCSLSFNTNSDGSGHELDFSSPSAGLSSLLRMAVYNINTVYAVYRY